MVIHDNIGKEVVPVSLKIAKRANYGGSLKGLKWRLIRGETPGYKIDTSRLSPVG
jgi:hypothetical protein